MLKPNPFALILIFTTYLKIIVKLKSKVEADVS